MFGKETGVSVEWGHPVHSGGDRELRCGTGGSRKAEARESLHGGLRGPRSCRAGGTEAGRVLGAKASQGEGHPGDSPRCPTAVIQRCHKANSCRLGLSQAPSFCQAGDRLVNRQQIPRDEHPQTRPNPSLGWAQSWACSHFPPLPKEVGSLALDLERPVLLQANPLFLPPCKPINRFPLCGLLVSFPC